MALPVTAPRTQLKRLLSSMYEAVSFPENLAKQVEDVAREEDRNISKEVEAERDAAVDHDHVGGLGEVVADGGVGGDDVVLGQVGAEPYEERASAGVGG